MVGSVHTICYGACRVFAVTDILQESGYTRASLAALFANLVTYTPHHHTWIVAEVMKHVGHILLSPFVEIPVVSVFYFWHSPFVESLYHNHHTHFVRNTHVLRCRHVVRCTNGICTHILHDTNLAADGSFIYSTTQWPKVVMQANTLKLNKLSVQEEAFVGNYFQSSDSKRGVILVNQFVIFI